MVTSIPFSINLLHSQKTPSMLVIIQSLKEPDLVRDGQREKGEDMRFGELLEIIGNENQSEKQASVSGGIAEKESSSSRSEKSRRAKPQQEEASVKPLLVCYLHEQ
ncbi:hypothetical protein L1049_018041 [Liquidambar formosana]|uniref:Uncharacterized protein n=1 Tax=Liquidambar formosana TaxID=63359 RepID=A0AAP0NN05_LIQFO